MPRRAFRAGAAIDPREVWGREAPLIAEIGSGQGAAIVHAASAHPEVDFLAIEVFTAGLARTMLNAEQAGAQISGSSRRTRPKCSSTCCPRHPSTSSGSSSPTPGTRTSTTNDGS